MKYKDIIEEIVLIKQQRSDFIDKFDKDYEYVKDSLINAVNNNYINSIRVHKFLTHNKKIGKVKTAKFLQTIDLNENTKILELNHKNIFKIAEFTIN
tara:strand:- start:1647 stop:1937 length:291 start_codon:yes stop_codon:yes gene_type:complete